MSNARGRSMEHYPERSSVATREQAPLSRAPDAGEPTAVDRQTHWNRVVAAENAVTLHKGSVAPRE
jgi:hypothetical protein